MNQINAQEFHFSAQVKKEIDQEVPIFAKGFISRLP
jgi:hypothetical protein